ncbi:MAG: alanine dehydrogenase [Candidatus Binatia bacterium]
MRIGIPREIKDDENRVAITPSGVMAFCAQGHEVLVEAGAGTGSHIGDEAYRRAGATLVGDASEVWSRAELVLKVKEPLASEYRHLREDLVLFTYLHLAANEVLTRELLKSRCTAIAYETVQSEDGSLPLLVPMSEVAGRLAVQVGAASLEKYQGGKGILLPGVAGVRRGRVTILGAGVAGFNACVVAVGLGADVTILDINPRRLAYVSDVVRGNVTSLMSNRANVEAAVAEADLVIGAVLIPGAKAPRLVTRELLRRMEPRSAFVDIAVDQGGCAETTRATTHHDPRYIEEDIIHYAVANMPGAVPQTSTYALTNVTMSYALEIAEDGWRSAVASNPALARGVNCTSGRLVSRPVAEAFGMGWEELGY